MIEGVIITPLKRFPDERGMVMHMLKSEDVGFKGFGEVYGSTVLPGAVKGWHIHKRMTLNYAVPVGMIKFVLYDDRKGSPTEGQIQEIFMGESNYVRVTVPPLVWNGFKGIHTEASLVINMTDIPHDPDEIDRCDPHECHIPYNWARKDR